MNRRILLHLWFWLAYALYDGYLRAVVRDDLRRPDDLGAAFDGLPGGVAAAVDQNPGGLPVAVPIPAAEFENKKNFRLGLQFLLTAVRDGGDLRYLARGNLPHIYHIARRLLLPITWVAAFRLLWSRSIS